MKRNATRGVYLAYHGPTAFAAIPHARYRFRAESDVSGASRFNDSTRDKTFDIVKGFVTEIGQRYASIQTENLDDGRSAGRDNVKGFVKIDEGDLRGDVRALLPVGFRFSPE